MWSLKVVLVLVSVLESERVCHSRILVQEVQQLVVVVDKKQKTAERRRKGMNQSIDVGEQPPSISISHLHFFSTFNHAACINIDSVQNKRAE